MATLTTYPRETQGPDINRPAGALFAKVFQVYLNASAAIQDVIVSMTQVINDPASDEEQRDAALDTLVEVLFAPERPEDLGTDLESSEDGGPREAARIRAGMARQEAAFAQTVLRLMRERGMTQKALAKKIAVGQPAVSMILSRGCRPQRATVHRIAKALGVEPKQLWPD
jgi:lambda repressor-like predicted transcriptional regulator